jgi:hypothetical protein
LDGDQQGLLIPAHGLINYIDTKEILLSKIIDLLRDFTAGVTFHLSEAPTSSQLHTVCILYFDTGKRGRGRELNQRES